MAVIQTKDELHHFLSKIVRESVAEANTTLVEFGHYLHEQEDEEEEKDTDDELFADDADDADDAGDTKDTATAKPKDAEKTADKSDDSEKPKKTKADTEAKADEPPVQEPAVIPNVGDVTLDMLNQKLNMLRSGRSLRDATIAGEMQEYFNGLSDDERLALWTYLNGLLQILAGSVSGDKATDPQSAGEKISVHPAHGTDKGQPRSGDSSDTPRGVEDTMAPIKVTVRS